MILTGSLRRFLLAWLLIVSGAIVILYGPINAAKHRTFTNDLLAPGMTLLSEQQLPEPREAAEIRQFMYHVSDLAGAITMGIGVILVALGVLVFALANAKVKHESLMRAER